jgi:molecular chaperone GrpE
MTSKKKQAPHEEEFLKEDQTEETKQEAGEEIQEPGVETKEKKNPEDEAMETKYLRLMADFQNYKKRSEKEKADIYAFANEKIILELLDVIDNYERALSHQGEEGSVLQEGMAMIYKQFKGVLEKNGVVEIQALGQDFDPSLHNAVMTESTPEYQHGKVSFVLQKGYLLNSKVIRHTMVKVAE